MASQLRSIAKFEDLQAVKNFLFPDQKNDIKRSENDELENNWDELEFGWEVDNEEKQEPKHETDEITVKEEFPWLQKCILTISPTMEIVALAREDRMMVLNQKWDSQAKGDMQNKFSIVLQDTFKYEDGGIITDLLCLPLYSQKRSSPGGPDWTCIIVGFSSGWVRMYTETGVLLISQLLHEERVLKIKCKTYAPPRHLGDSEQHEELTILYQRALVTIDGFSLFQTLRGCRNQVARAAASGSDFIQPPPMEYKKWALQNQDRITDHCSPGIVTPNAFDQMLTASMLGGFSATIKATPPVASVYATTGQGPTVGFYYAIEGSAPPLWSEVATAVASKLKTALFSAASGLFRISGSSKQADDEKRKPKVEPCTPLPIRFGLPDKLRRADAICLSPNCKLLATADAFGRVLLLDVASGAALRMWKGYRDAEVGWIEVKEEVHSSRDHDRHHKHSSSSRRLVRAVLFLLIYAPRRGILEVWSPEQGTRVAAFNVSKSCRLVCPGFGMMGLNNVNHRDVKVTVVPCLLIDPDGNMKVVEIPFHLALSDKNSRKARDLHLLKKLKVTLKDSAEETGQLVNELSTTLQEIRTPAVRHQAVQRLLDTKFLSISAVEKLLQTALEVAQAEPCQDENAKSDVRSLVEFCQVRLRLVHAYDAIARLNAHVENEAKLEDTRSPQEILAEHLSLSAMEVDAFLEHVDTYRAATLTSPTDGRRRVTFQPTAGAEPPALSKFLACFENGGRSPTTSSTVALKPNLNDNLVSSLAHFLFETSLNGAIELDNLKSVLTGLGLPAEQLLLLLMHLWLSNDYSDLAVLPTLKQILAIVTSMEDASHVTVDNGELSPWWDQLRRFLVQASNTSPALVAAMVARSLAFDLSNKSAAATADDSGKDAAEPPTPLDKADESAEMGSSNSVSGGCDEGSVTSSSSDWEAVSMDLEQWNILIRQLEHVVWLTCLLRWRTLVHNSQLTSVSVHSILEGGRGIFAELVSKWVVHAQIRPDRLIFTDERSVEATPTATPVQSPDERDDVRAIFANLRRRLPLSLAQDVVMANCCWEYAAEWNRDAEVVTNLKCSLDYLQLVDNAALKHGLCTLIWNTFVVKRMKTTADLIEKTGRALVNLRHRKEVGVKDLTNLQKFLSRVTSLLETMLTANCDSESVTSRPSFANEDLWQEVRGQTPLVDLAVDQAKSNYGLVKHHYHVCVFMDAIQQFNMKQANVLTLFDTKGRSCLFKALNSHPLLPTKNVDVAIINGRRLFLARVVSHAVHALAKAARNDRCETAAPAPAIGGHLCPLYVKWTRLCSSVADDLGVDVNSVRMHHVCELYSYGYDKMAEEVLQTVQDHAVMGSMLVVVAGRRLAHFLLNCDPADGVDNLARISPTMSTWLRSLDPYELKCPNAAISDTATLIGHVVNQLPEGHASYSFAISMVELVQNFT